jgi:nicotinate-nucleotide adenylyltransferase
MRIGLFFGSFNPFHIGHKAIGSYIAQNTEVDQVWYVVSPQNPLKQKSSLLDQYHRLQIIRRDIENQNDLFVSDIEFSLPTPSYTIDTVVNLSEKHPEHTFSLIMGGDNIKTLHKWKNYEQILENYFIYVYPRYGFDFKLSHKHVVYLKEVPMMDISAMFIRESIKNGKDMSSFIPYKAWKYIDEMNFYK